MLFSLCWVSRKLGCEGWFFLVIYLVVIGSRRGEGLILIEKFGEVVFSFYYGFFYYFFSYNVVNLKVEWRFFLNSFFFESEDGM